MGIFSGLRLPKVSAHDIVDLDAHSVLLDVREKSEWNAGHAVGAIHVPLGRIADAGRRLPKGKRVVVVCRSGNRSRSATSALIRSGFEAVNLSGGMRAYERAGGRVVDRNNRPGQVI